jgi:putative hydrolase of the HAD superfamily
MANITHIYFDWSGTLAKKGTREQFIYGPKSKKLDVLYKHSLPLIKRLVKQGFTLGIITNTSHDTAAFRAALESSGLGIYFKGAVITNNEPGMCRKPCPDIFKLALEIDKIKPSAALMVGDKYDKDILGAREVGMNTYFVNGR